MNEIINHVTEEINH